MAGLYPISPQIAEQYLSQVEVCFQKGNEGAALSAVRQAFATAKENNKVTLMTHLANVLPENPTNKLKDIGIFTVADVLQTSEEELLIYANIGSQTTAMIRRILVINGFEWVSRNRIDED